MEESRDKIYRYDGSKEVLLNKKRDVTFSFVLYLNDNCNH